MKLKDMLLSDSTRKLLEEADRSTDLSFFQKLHAYIYLKWAYLYISLGTGEHRLAKALKPAIYLFNKLITREKSASRGISFADTYHGKVVTTKDARQLVTLNQKIDLRNLEQIIPYKRAKDIVLTNPDHIAALECPCRTARENPCTPIDVCLIIGDPFVSFVLEHHPTKARKITADEAEQILIDEHRRGHVHHAFFKDAMLNRFYAICNCCSCCCGAMQAQRNGVPMLSSSGYVCIVDREKCVGCGLCVQHCQFDAMHIDEEKKVVVDYQHCMGCGACLSSCRKDALLLEQDEKKGVPLEIYQLLEKASRKQEELVEA